MPSWGVVRLCLRALVLALLPACGGEPGVELDISAGDELDVTGSFEDGDAIPSRLTCDGANRSPQLSWGRLGGID